MSIIEKLLIAAILLCLGAAGYAAYREATWWKKFQAEHNCKPVAHIKGATSIGVGVGSNGSVTVIPITEPDRTGWLCDDGITYYR